jgi:hypothetical protein
MGQRVPPHRAAVLDHHRLPREPLQIRERLCQNRDAHEVVQLGIVLRFHIRVVARGGGAGGEGGGARGAQRGGTLARLSSWEGRGEGRGGGEGER